MVQSKRETPTTTVEARTSNLTTHSAFGASHAAARTFNPSNV